MKLPRYTQAQSQPRITQELQSVRAGTITPGERAREATAKYGAVAAGAKVIGDIFAGIADIKSQEELSAAANTYDAAINKVHRDLTQFQYEVDGNGNLIYDESEIIKQEADARATLQSAIIGNMKYEAAKNGFGNYVSKSGGGSASKFASDVAKVSADVTKLNVDNQIGVLLNAKSYDEADKRNAQAVSNGAYGEAEYNEQRDTIRKRRTTGNVWDVLNTAPEDVDKTDINDQLDILEDPEFTDIDGDEKNVLIGKLYSQLGDLDKVVDENRDDYYRQVYNKLLPLAVDGELPLSDLINSGIPPDDSLFQDLLGRVAGKDTEPKSEQGAKQAYRNRIRRLSSRSGIMDGEDWGASVDALIDEMQNVDSGLNYTDSQALADELTSDIAAIYTKPKFKILNRQVYQSITGYEPGAFDNMEAMFSAQFKTSNLVALKFQEELSAKARQYGASRLDELDKWVDRETPLFKARLNDDLFKSVGVNIDWDGQSGGFNDELKISVQQQMFKHVDKYPGDLQKAVEVIKEMERLNNITLMGIN